MVADKLYQFRKPINRHIGISSSFFRQTPNVESLFGVYNKRIGKQRKEIIYVKSDDAKIQI